MESPVLPLISRYFNILHETTENVKYFFQKYAKNILHNSSIRVIIRWYVP